MTQIKVIFQSRTYYSFKIMRKLLQFCNLSLNIINAIAPYSFDDAKEALLKLDYSSISKILQAGFINTNEDGNILIFALNQGKQDAAVFLIQNFHHLLDFNKRNDKGDSPLMLAIFRKLHKVIKILIPKCNINACDFRRNTPFIAAAANGDVQTLILLKQQVDCNTLIKNIDGHSALHRACYFGQIKVVDWLLKNTKLKIGERDKRGCNALHLACEGLNIDLTRYIMNKVKHSQRLLTANKEGKTPIDVIMEVIENVAPPNDLKNVSLKHLKNIQHSLL